MSDIEGYSKFTEDNFVFEIISISGRDKTGSVTTAGVTKSYNASTGIITFNISQSGGTQVAFVYGNVYIYY